MASPKFSRACLRLALAIFASAQFSPLHAAGAEPGTPAAMAPVTAGRLSALPVEAFGRLPFVEQAELSPKGDLIAGLIGVEGKQVIAIFHLFDPAVKPHFLGVPEDTEAAWVEWVNNDNILVGLQAVRPLGFGDKAVISRLLAVNWPRREFKKLLWNMEGQNASRVVWIPADGSSSILVGAQNSIYLGDGFWPSVYKLDVETGKSRMAVEGRDGVLRWQADATGTVRSGVGYSDEGRSMRLLYRPVSGNEGFKVVDRAHTRKNTSLLDPFLFIPGTDRALVMHDDDKGFSAIYEVDMATQQEIRQVYAPPAGTDIARVILSADGASLLGARLSGADPRSHWIDPDLAEIQAALDKSVGSRRARIISMSADRSILLIRVDRPDSPGTLYYFDTASAKMQRIGYFNSAIEARTLSPVTLIRYKAREGLEIEAVLTLPRDRPHKNLPIVVMPHGGPWSHDTLSYDYWAQFLASRGYGVLQPNFRGSTGYGTEFLKAGEGQMGLAMQDDISDGLAWAVKEGLADPKRACIVGASYGGYAAMWGLVKDPDLYRCAISIAGVANVRREVNDFGSYLFGGRYKDDWQKMTPDFAAVSPANFVDRIKAPLLLIHGRKDITVDFAQSERMNDRMRNAGKVVEFLPLKDADHHFTREADRIALLQAIETFLARYNPADPDPQEAK